MVLGKLVWVALNWTRWPPEVPSNPNLSVNKDCKDLDCELKYPERQLKQQNTFLALHLVGQHCSQAGKELDLGVMGPVQQCYNLSAVCGKACRTG